MKISEAWLREWVALETSTDALAERLTLSGLEVDSVVPASGDFRGVVVGRLAALAPHPDAGKLTVCEVDAGGGEVLTIVCGADNIYEGMHAPVALPGAVLPGGVKIRKARLRGVSSAGMLCSARELGFGDDHSGIMDLGGAGEPGEDLRELLALDDQVIDVDLTPNRGDCLGMEGVARDVAATMGKAFSPLPVAAVPAQVQDSLDVEIRAPESCPRYAGRVLRNIDASARTPMWMCERLRRGGLRPIHPVVDVTNYVMLELGQPMHAFDLSSLTGGIVVRRAKEGEVLVLLDGQEVTLGPRVTVIADHSRVLAMAGIMGGEGSGVATGTRDIFLESAFFAPLPMAGVARAYGLHTDASHRFERGVDPTLQERAIERATALLLDITGGEPGPVTVAEDSSHIPKAGTVLLRPARLSRLLGLEINPATVTDILERLGMQADFGESGWKVLPPAHRFDIAIEEDLIEEVARIHGYDKIPEIPGQATVDIDAASLPSLPLERITAQLLSRGYSEAVTYSFVDPELQEAMFPDVPALELNNPIASNLAMMRVSLWPGLITAAQSNLSRRQARVRLFEYGMRFRKHDEQLRQDYVLAGIICGKRYPEQWGAGNDDADFYDLKGDVESLLAGPGLRGRIMFNASTHTALHPGRSAEVCLDGKTAGWLGELHPALVNRLDLPVAPLLFELDADALSVSKIQEVEAISRYPEIRRDIAMWVPDEVTAAQIEDAVLADRPEVLRDLLIFDVYRGDNIDSELKSVALGLILQDSSRTLTDKEADAVVAHATRQLEKKVRARIRG